MPFISACKMSYFFVCDWFSSENSETKLLLTPGVVAMLRIKILRKFTRALQPGD
jgi:hypothetical protein